MSNLAPLQPTLLDKASWISLGGERAYKFTVWEPDIALNVQYAHLAFLIRTQPVVGAIIRHRSDRHSGGWCEGMVHFETELTAAAFRNNTRWTVEQWRPLTLSEPIQCPCGFGWIRNGRWETR